MKLSPHPSPLPKAEGVRAFAVVLAALLAIALATPAFANGRPIQIVLTYLPNVSTTGPQNASGIAELVLAEGEARVAATGLPRLDPPQHYQAWIVNTNTSEFLALGSFNTAFTTGTARLDLVLPQPIPDRGWNLFLVTIEEVPTPARPSEQRSIAGHFPPSGAEPQPNVLPNTGGPLPPQPSVPDNRPDWSLAAGLAALTLVGGAAAGYVLGTRRSAIRR